MHSRRRPVESAHISARALITDAGRSADARGAQLDNSIISLQFLVLGFGLLENRDTRVSVFPNRQKVLIGGAALRLVPLNRVGAAQSKSSHHVCVKILFGRMENLLEVCSRLFASAC